MPAQPPAPRRRPLLAASIAVLVAGLAGGCFLSSSPSASPSPSSGQPASGPPGSQAERATPSPSKSAAPAGELAPGTYAQVLVDGLRVRVDAKPDATAVGALFFGDVVRIRASAGKAGGYTWYEVETYQTINDTPLTGYVAGAHGEEAYLKALAAKPSPTPSHSPTPSPTPSPKPSATASSR